MARIKGEGEIGALDLVEGHGQRGSVDRQLNELALHAIQVRVGFYQGGCVMKSPKPGLHHVAYACRDIDATHHFYEELMGFHLVHTEIVEKDGGFFRHTFYDTGDGSCLAFFDLHGVGEQDDWASAISTGNGLPVWVNHVAFSATGEKQAEVKARMTAAGIEPLMEIDHGWCHSLYYVDPNGIMVEFCRDTPGIEPDHELAKSLLHATSMHAAKKVHIR